MLSSLFFLRFLCPAIVRCESFMQIEPLSIDERRAMVLVTKILQAIANGVEMKETHLANLNPFIGEKSALVKDMCSKLIVRQSLSLSLSRLRPPFRVSMNGTHIVYLVVSFRHELCPRCPVAGRISSIPLPAAQS